MNTSPTVCKNLGQDKAIKVEINYRENRMRTLLIISLLSIPANFVLAECTDYMQASNKHQLVIKGMMDLNFQGKMNA